MFHLLGKDNVPHDLLGKDPFGLCFPPPVLRAPLFLTKPLLGCFESLVGVIDLVFLGPSNLPVLQKQHQKHPEHQDHRPSPEIEPPGGTAFNGLHFTHCRSEGAAPAPLDQAFNPLPYAFSGYFPAIWSHLPIDASGQAPPPSPPLHREDAISGSRFLRKPCSKLPFPL